MFRAVVARVQHGESYYPAMNAELRGRGFPTASVFNWRPPFLFLPVAAFPRAMVVLQILLMGAVLIGTLRLFDKAPAIVLPLAGAIQVGAVHLALKPDGVYKPELWAGGLMALSVLAYLSRRTALAVACGVLAVMAREIALPYALVCLGLALYDGRRKEAGAWIVGLAVWAALYGWHVAHVLPFIQPGDYAHPSWLAFGGWTFVVSTVGWSGVYHLLPRWVSALGAVAALSCLWAPVDRHLKAVVLVYVAVFCVVGLPLNGYWGIMTGPSWVIATAYGAWKGWAKWKE